jgi:hypothetical protein
MRIGELRTLIENRSDSELVFLALYDKDEVNEHIMNNISDQEPEITHEEWIYVYTKMIEDDGIWTELTESFRYYVDNVIEQRAKGKTNDDSK